MEIFPAIDIMDGKVVRLTEGDFDRMKVYGGSPSDMAEEFRAVGAKNLHVVDLDGAKEGRTANFQAVSDILKCPGLFVEVGGGIRGRDVIERYAELGVSRVILGTVAVRNFRFVEEAVKEYGSLIAVGVDARDGKVAVQGWLDITDLDSVEFCKKLSDAGVSTVIYTDIARDGRLVGANIRVYEELCSLDKLDIIASGGISSLEEIAALRDMGTYGAIIGKALYEGKVSLARAIGVAIAKCGI